MDKFYGNIDTVQADYLLQATPYKKEPRINFMRRLGEQEFLTEMYAETSPEEERDILKANRDFMDQINKAMKCIDNPFAKVDLIHISGYAGCGKTTFVRHLLWTTFQNNLTEKSVVDFEGETVVSQAYRSALAQKIYHDVKKGGKNLRRLGSLEQFDLKRFQKEALNALFALQKRLSGIQRTLPEKAVEQFLAEQSAAFSQEEQYVYYLLTLDFLWELSAHIEFAYQTPFIIFFDNVDSISDLDQNRIFVTELKQFINDCNFFFGINLNNENLFEGMPIAKIIRQAKFVCFLTTRIVTIRRFLSLAPDLERVYGWTSLQMPEHFYSHTAIINRRLNYFKRLEGNRASETLNNLNQIAQFANGVYKSHMFRKIFNSNFRYCVDTLCSLVQRYTSTGLIQEANRLYQIQPHLSQTVEGASGIVLSMLCNYLKDHRVYSEKLHLSECLPDGKISLSRIILTIIREKDGHCSFQDLLEILSPFFPVHEICAVTYDLMEAKRDVLRRMVAFDIIFPKEEKEIERQGDAYISGDQDVSHYSEISICISGMAYLDYVVPHFEFMLSRHRFEYDYVTNRSYQPLFSQYSEIPTGASPDQRYRFEQKIDWVFADVRDCCQNSVGFSQKIMDKFHWDRDAYIDSFFNYHMINRDGSPGYRQSYESRLIFSHIGYIERYRRYLLQKQKYEPSVRRDFNRRLIRRLKRYVELYQNESLCFHTVPQDTVAAFLMNQIDVIEKSDYLDFETKVEYNGLY